MAGLLGTLAVLSLIALGVWIFGSVALRLVGAPLFLLGLLMVATGALVGLLLIVLGALLWLAGHWLFAYKHHVYRSGVAQRVLQGSAMPAWVDPTRGWAVPVHVVVDGQQDRAGMG